MNGQGKFTHANNDFFEGNFKNDKANGFGAFTKTDGEVYKG